jgi:hypothetical protein
MTEQTQPRWMDCALLSLEPLVTITSIERDWLGLPELSGELREIFDRPRGLHLLSPTWCIDSPYAAVIGNELVRLSAELPGHRFVLLAGDGVEQFRLSREGLDTIICNTASLIDERRWRICKPALPGWGFFEAVYNARLMHYKRHYLAGGIANLLLIHANPIGEAGRDESREIMKRLPNAVSANNMLLHTTDAELDAEKLPEVLAHAGCGLALSAVEGAMKASLEYMLCGLPVVSTDCDGSRTRYYANPFVRIVEASQDAVAGAVLELGAGTFDRYKVRQRISAQIAFDRHNALIALNQAIKHAVGDRFRLPSLRSLLGFKQNFYPADQMVERIRQQAGIFASGNQGFEAR